MKLDYIKINEKSNIAICTLWSKKETILNALPENLKNKICIIGTLYSKFGIHYMLRTLGENTNINTLIVYGEDLSESGNALKEVFVEKKIDFIKFKKDTVLKLINSIKFIDLREEYKNNNLNALINTINEHYSENVKREKIIFKENLITTKSLDYAIVGQRIYEKSIFWAWIKLLYLIYNYGFLKPSEYGESQKEIINLMVTIDLKGEKYNLDKEFFEVGFEKEMFEKHVKEILSPEKPNNVEYSYGERLFNHPLGKNQIEFIISKLSKSPYSRRAVAITWYHSTDMGNPYPPCIDFVQGIISGDYYHHIFVLRSNDMVKGWPVNFYGQIKLAEYIIKKINETTKTNYKLGTVTSLSISAHIYEHDFDDVEKILNKYFEKSYKFIEDPLGNFVISMRNSIELKHFDNEGKNLIEEKIFNSVEDIYAWFKKVGIYLLPDHCLYLGKIISELKYNIKKSSD